MIDAKTRAVWCQNCQAQPGERCTRATDTTRRPVEWHHASREADAYRG